VLWRDHFEYALWARDYRPWSGWGLGQRVDATEWAREESPRVAVGAGRAIAVWSQDDGDHYSIFATHTVLGGWSAAELLEDDVAGMAHSPQIAMNAVGNGVAIWLHVVDARVDLLASRYRDAVGWSVPQPIELDEVGDASWPALAMSPGGRAVAVWRQWDGAHWSIMANALSAGGGP
jgi:hypothetical protein